MSSCAAEDFSPAADFELFDDATALELRWDELPFCDFGDGEDSNGDCVEPRTDEPFADPSTLLPAGVAVEERAKCLDCTGVLPSGLREGEPPTPPEAGDLTSTKASNFARRPRSHSNSCRALTNS